MAKRYSPKLTITLPQAIVDRVAEYQQDYGAGRSAIIQQALIDWLDKHKPLEPLLINGQPYEPGKIAHDYLTPDMGAIETMQVMDEFEAARQQHYTRSYHGK